MYLYVCVCVCVSITYNPKAIVWSHIKPPSLPTPLNYSKQIAKGVYSIIFNSFSLYFKLKWLNLRSLFRDPSSIYYVDKMGNHFETIVDFSFLLRRLRRRWWWLLFVKGFKQSWPLPSWPVPFEHIFPQHLGGNIIVVRNCNLPIPFSKT